MESATRVVGQVATAVTLLSFSGGLPLCRQIYRQQTSKDVPLLPLAAGCFCTVVWLLYGYATEDSNVIVVNLLGVPLQIFNVLVHRFYADRKASPNDATVFWVLLCLVTGALVSRDHMSADSLGLVGSVASICCLMSPLPAMPRVFRERDATCLPFSIVMWQFVVSALWAVYGVLLADPNLYVANLVGVGITIFELVIIATFPGSRPKQLHVDNGSRKTN